MFDRFRKRFSKKAQISDVITAIVFLSVTVFIFFILLNFLQNFRTAAANANMPASSLNVLDSAGTAFNVWDRFLPFLVIGLTGSLIWSASQLRTNPIFFVINMFLLIFVVIAVAAPLSNAVDIFVNLTHFTNQTDDLPNTIRIGRNLPLYTTIFSVALLIFLYGKRGSGGL